jgi:hypothetical protein
VRWFAFEYKVSAFSRRKRDHTAHPDHFWAVDKLDRATLNRVSHFRFHGSAVGLADTPAGYTGVATGDYEPPPGQESAVGTYFNRDFITVIPKWMMDAPHELGFGIALVTVLVVACVTMSVMGMTVGMLLAIPV